MSRPGKDAPAGRRPSFQRRLYLGAPLEPRGGILHGAGQDEEAWRAYCRMMEPHGLRPDLFMAYAGLKNLSIERLQAFSRYWRESRGTPPLIQLGLSMTSDGQPEKCYAGEVAEGRHDDSIRLLGRFFEQERQPLLVRIGYECTGPWNGYQPDSYIRAFQRVARMLRETSIEVATVWCVEGGWTGPADDYYPGDEHVDWCSVDLFSPDHFDAAGGFMEKCRLRRKPVLIGECTPRRVGVLGGAASWEAWFAPFFDFIARHPHVKGFSYINWDWSGYPQWSDWGDARIQQNDIVRENWIQTVGEIARMGSDPVQVTEQAR